MDLTSNDPDGRIQLKIDILGFYEPHEDFFTDDNGEDRDTEKARRALKHGRPDGVASDKQGRVCFFLEFTRPVDASRETPARWAERKDT